MYNQFGDVITVNDYGDILTVDDVKEILGIGKNAVYKLCRERSIKCFRINRSWKIPKKSVYEFIEEERNKGFKLNP